MKTQFMRMWNGLRQRLAFRQSKENHGKFRNRGLSLLGVLLLIVWTALGIYWSQEPELDDVAALASAQAEANGQRLVVGYTTTFTLRHLADTLLTKPGGYLSNDISPPSVFLDNMPSWEFGVLVQIRDLSRSLRKDLSRSQSQSTEDPQLSLAEPKFHFDNDSWILPSTEGEYKEAIEYVDAYLARLANDNEGGAQFYARADNLSTWLRDVETRLGSMSQRLSASVEQRRFNTDLAGEANAEQSTPTQEQTSVKTPRLLVDNVFYEARGTAWALMHIFKAIEVDFLPVLEDKNATVSVQQIIRELESTQETVWSPFIMNGSGMGVFANHSLVMANYISRANAAIVDLRELLENG